MQVTPQNKYYMCITLLTVAVMYIVVSYLVPLLTTLLNSYKISTRWLELTKGVVVFIGSIGAYTAFSQLLINIFEHNLWLKKYIFGNEYLHGTWIGSFTNPDTHPTNPNTQIFTVEYFTQSLDSLKIKGTGYISNGDVYADWDSLASSIDRTRDKLIYTYTCDSGNDSFQGVCVFNFEKKLPDLPPKIIHGYSADLTDGVRTYNKEYHISDEFMDSEEALRTAISLF